MTKSVTTMSHSNQISFLQDFTNCVRAELCPLNRFTWIFVLPSKIPFPFALPLTIHAFFCTLYILPSWNWRWKILLLASKCCEYNELSYFRCRCETPTSSSWNTFNPKERNFKEFRWNVDMRFHKLDTLHDYIYSGGEGCANGMHQHN